MWAPKRIPDLALLRWYGGHIIFDLYPFTKTMKYWKSKPKPQVKVKRLPSAQQNCLLGLTVIQDCLLALSERNGWDAWKTIITDLINASVSRRYQAIRQIIANMGPLKLSLTETALLPADVWVLPSANTSQRQSVQKVVSNTDAKWYVYVSVM